MAEALILSIWLVEIRLKDWVHGPADQDRVVTYEEVEARDEYGARHAGFDQFSRRCQYEPVMRQKMHRRGLTPKDCCSADAVEI